MIYSADKVTGIEYRVLPLEFNKQIDKPYTPQKCKDCPNKGHCVEPEYEDETSNINRTLDWLKAKLAGINVDCY